MKKQITKEGLEKIKKELENLEKQKRKEIAEKLRHAASFGDLSENAAYEEAKEEQEFVERRIMELKNIIKESVVAEKTDHEKVQFGSKVTIFSEDGEEVYSIVSANETDLLEGKISVDSPLAKAMMGLKKGDKFKVNAPEGERSYRVVDIE
jgi:transcription elongation factor GreA